MDGVTSFRNGNLFQSIFRFQSSGAAVAGGGAAALAGLGSAGATAGAIGGAVAGGASSAANFVLQQAGEAVKNMAIVMMILGIFQYFLRWTIGDGHIIVFTLSLVLFILAGYALAESLQIARLVVFIPMIIFSIWYFVFKANYMPSFLIYFLTISGLSLLVIDVITKGKAVKAELLGFLPVIFLFLDIGLVPFLVENVGLPILPLTENLILWMPWWAFFGLMTFPLDSVRNSFVNGTMRIMHIIGVMYVIFVFLVPMVPALGYDASSLIPDASTFSESQASMRERLGDGENPFKSNAICFYEALSKMDGTFSINECVAERQIMSIIETHCEEAGYSKGSNAFNSCVELEQGALEDREGEAGGVSSYDLDQHVAIEISKSSYFDDEISARVGGYSTVQFPIDVRVENPNEEEFEVKVGCNFIAKDKQNDDVEGIVEHASFDEAGKLKITENDEYTFLCVPIADLDGTYSLNFTIAFNMVTESYLKRVFVDDYDLDNEFQQQAIAAFLDKDEKTYSADEFVRVNFAVGQPSENPVIELDDVPLLVTDIENIGEGSIGVINGYELILDGLNLESENGNDECVYGYEPIYFDEGNDEGDSILVGSCYVSLDYSIEEEIERKGMTFRIFQAKVDYDYFLQEKYKVEVALREEISNVESELDSESDSESDSEEESEVENEVESE
jgi:hypothetical protein